MRKTDKKIDNQLRTTLTEVCEAALKEFNGFEWLTHIVNYDDFPRSLRIVCIFDSNENLHDFMSLSHHHSFNLLIERSLLAIDIKLKHTHKQISYDTEENCELKNAGNWAQKLSTLT